MQTHIQKLSKRQQRIGEELRRLLTLDMLSFRLPDGYTEYSITITQVVPSPDLRQAKVYFVVLGKELAEIELMAKNLNACRREIQGKLKKNIVMRFLPRSLFFLTRLQRAKEVGVLLSQIASDRDGSASDGAGLVAQERSLMRTEFRLAWRYLKPVKDSFISVVSGFAFVGLCWVWPL